MTPSPNGCNVNVAGTTFTFSRTSFEQPHMVDTIMSKTVLGKNSDVAPLFDVDPKLFETWLAPYIRHEVLPKGLKSQHEREHLIAAANTIGLIALAQSVEQMGIPKTIRMPYTIRTPNNYNDRGFIFFDDNVAANHRIFQKIRCPDKACKITFNPQNALCVEILLNHFRGSPHNGTITVHAKFGDYEFGIIECEMQNYQELVLENDNLVFPKEATQKK